VVGCKLVLLVCELLVGLWLNSKQAFVGVKLLLVGLVPWEGDKGREKNGAVEWWVWLSLPGEEGPSERL